VNFIAEILLGKNSSVYKRSYEMEQNLLELRVRLGLGLRSQLPKVHKVKGATINDIYFNRGDIVERPMYHKLEKWYMKHYGYLYGVDRRGVPYIINKLDDGLVYCHDLDTYMNDFDIKDIRKIEKLKETTIEQIVNRSLSIETQPYTAMNNNCQHFVNYSVFGSSNSLTVDITKREIFDKFKSIRERFRGEPDSEH